jgi:hypothetical protein
MITSASSTGYTPWESFVEEYLAAVEVARAPGGRGASATRAALSAAHAQRRHRAASPAAVHPCPADPGCGTIVN